MARPIGNPRTLEFRKRSVRIALASITIAPLLLAGAIAVGVSVLGQRLPFADELIASVALFGVACAGVVACVWTLQITRPNGIAKIILLFGTVLPLLGWISILTSLWSIGTPDTIAGRAGVVGLLWAGVIAFWALASMFRVRSWALWMRHAAVMGVAGCALAISIAAIRSNSVPGPWQVGLLGSSLSLAILSSILVCLLTAIFPSLRVRREVARAGEKTMSLPCPICATPQVIVVGRRMECPACALGFTLTLDAPTCACGYTLAELTGTSCPECGAEVPRRHSWALASARPTPSHPSV